MNSTYTERWQYLPWVGTHKKRDDDEKDPFNDLGTKQMTCMTTPTKDYPFHVGVKDFTFSQLVDALRKGHCIKRIGPFDASHGTKFLVIDIDNDFDERITPEELDSFCNGRDDVEWTVGGSKSPFRYHILKYLDHAISTSSEAETDTKAVLAELAKHIGRNIKIKPDAHQFALLQWCYGVPQDRMERRELPDTLYWCKQITDGNNYEVVKVDPNSYKPRRKAKKTTKQDKSSQKPHIMPYNTAMLASKLFDGKVVASKNEDGSYVRPLVCLEGKRFDCFEPHSAKRTVPIGKRYEVAQAWTMRLVPQFYRCRQFGLNYTEDDIKYTFETLCKRNFEDADAWWKETGESMQEGLVKELESVSGLDFAEIEAKYQPSHNTELYKRRGYGIAAAIDILDNYAAVSTDDGTATLPSRSYLDEILAKYHISYTSFMAYMKDPYFNLKIIYEDDGRLSHTYDYVLNAVKDNDNQFFYCTRNEGIKSFCRNHGITYVSLLSVYSGTRKEYNYIRKVAQDAAKDMWKYFDSLEAPNYVVPPKKSIEDHDGDEDIELPFHIETTPWNLPDDLPVYL